MIFASYTDRALRQAKVECEHAMHDDQQHRERLIRIAAETETEIHTLGRRMSVAALVIEALEAEIEERGKSQEAMK